MWGGRICYQIAGGTGRDIRPHKGKESHGLRPKNRFTFIGGSYLAPFSRFQIGKPTGKGATSKLVLGPGYVK